MSYNPAIRHRRSIRLNGSESSQTGSYFITIWAQNRQSLFGEIVDGEMRLNELRKIIHAEKFESVGAGSKPALLSLSEIVWQFKTFPAVNAEKPRLAAELL